MSKFIKTRYDLAKQQMDEQNETVLVVEVEGKITHVSRRQATEAFNSVCNSSNWKNPIKALIQQPTALEAEILRESVIFFTGSVPTFTPRGHGKCLVEAAGYYATIGA